MLFLRMGLMFVFEEERKRLDDILCHDLELMSLLLRSFAIFSMYRLKN